MATKRSAPSGREKYEHDSEDDETDESQDEEDDSDDGGGIDTVRSRRQIECVFGGGGGRQPGWWDSSVVGQLVPSPSVPALPCLGAPESASNLWIYPSTQWVHAAEIDPWASGHACVVAFPLAAQPPAPLPPKLAMGSPHPILCPLLGPLPLHASEAGVSNHVRVVRCAVLRA